MRLIGILLIFGGIGYAMEVFLKGAVMRMFIPSIFRLFLPKTKSLHSLRNSALCLLAGFLILSIWL